MVEELNFFNSNGDDPSPKASGRHTWRPQALNVYLVSGFACQLRTTPLKELHAVDKGTCQVTR